MDVDIKKKSDNKVLQDTQNKRLRAYVAYGALWESYVIERTNYRGQHPSDKSWLFLLAKMDSITSQGNFKKLSAKIMQQLIFQPQHSLGDDNARAETDPQSREKLDWTHFDSLKYRR